MPIEDDIAQLIIDVGDLQDEVNGLLNNQPFFTNQLIISNAELKGGAANYNIVPSIAGAVLLPFSVTIQMIYGGNNPFTNSGWTATISYNGFTLATIGIGSAFTNATESAYASAQIANANNGAVLSAIGGDPVVMNISEAFTGNAANDNYLIVTTIYSVTQY